MPFVTITLLEGKDKEYIKAYGDDYTMKRNQYCQSQINSVY